jgi:hypothetical protein
MSYAYQWQRCNSSGASCLPISGATSSSYLLGSADVGSTMRISVTASNSAGSATTSSAATVVVSATSVSGVLERNRGPEMYALGDIPYNGLPGWTRVYQPSQSSATRPKAQADPLGSGKKVFNITTTPGDNPSAPAGSDFVGLDDWSADSNAAIAGQGADHWYSFEVMFPSSKVGLDGNPFRLADPSTWNATTFYEWHYNSTMGVSGNVPELAIGIRSQTGVAGMTWFVEQHGGDVSTNPSGTNINDAAASPGYVYNWKSIPWGQTVQPDRWYAWTIHAHWSKGSDGLIDIYLDGQPFYRVTGPTLYWRSSTGYVDMLYPMIDNYHPALSQNSTLFYRRWKMGTTRAIVEQ